MFNVKVEDGNVDRAIKKFLKLTKKHRVIEGCLEREQYVKPSKQRREKTRRRKRVLERLKQEEKEAIVE